MKININQISEVWTTFEFQERPQGFPVFKELSEAGECEFVSPVRAELSIIMIRDLIEVRGRVATEVKVKCGRCLEEFSLPVSSEFELTCSDKKDEQAFQEGEEVELRQEDMDMVYYTGDHIDFREQVQEQVILALPSYAQCRDDCKGLCQQCGANLNQGPCGCSLETGHPAFAVLKNLKTQKRK